MRSGSSTATILAMLVVFGGRSADAEETICDPENPACGESLALPSPEESNEETICDPENPACSGSLSNAARRSAPAANLTTDLASGETAARGFDTARFLGGWGTRLDIDSGFEGQGEDIVELSSHFDLGLEWEPSDDFRVVLNGRFRHWVGAKENPDEVDLLINASEVRAEYDVRLGEAYALWRGNIWSIGVGNIVTRWGSTDLTRPGDVLNPIDRSSISAMAAPERLPQLTADLTFAGPGWSIQGLLVPFFVPDRTWAFGRDTALLTSRNPVVRDEFPIDALLDEAIDRSVQDDIQPLVNGTRVPDEVPSSASMGLRGTMTVSNTDLGFGYWRGWDRTPFIYVDDDLRALISTVLDDGQVLDDFDFLAFFLRNPELVQVTERIGEKSAAGDELFFSEYRRMNMLLFDAARYIGPIGVRTDVAVFPQKTYLTEGFQAVRRPTLSAALGLSWERIQSEDDVVTITVEGFYDKPFAAGSSVTEAFVSEELRGDPDDALLLVDQGLYGIAGAFVWGIPWGSLQVQLGGVYNVSHGDVIASVAVGRRFSDLLDTKIGYTLFEGPDPEDRLTVGGLYDANDHISIAVGGAF